MAKRVHEYLQDEAKRSTIDMEVAFPVIQRQWDAVSAFGPQIVQRATRYLRVTEQNSEVSERERERINDSCVLLYFIADLEWIGSILQRSL